MQLCKYYPIANDRMGAIWTLASIKGACVIEFGPAGTTHYAIEGIGSLNGKHEANIYSTHMDQSDVTFGKYDRLEQAIMEVDENIKPKYIFVAMNKNQNTDKATNTIDNYSNFLYNNCIKAWRSSYERLHK